MWWHCLCTARTAPDCPCAVLRQVPPPPFQCARPWSVWHVVDWWLLRALSDIQTSNFAGQGHQQFLGGGYLVLAQGRAVRSASWGRASR
jgi:hypothetical protein